MGHARAWARRACAAAIAVTAATIVPVGGPAVAGAQAANPSKPAIFDRGTWYLRSTPTSGPATLTFRYGTGDDIPVMGDWDGDGDDTVGVVRYVDDGSGAPHYEWHLRNANSPGLPDVPVFGYGEVQRSDEGGLRTLPVVGDWDGDGDDTPGVVQYDPSPTGPIRWQLSNQAADVEPTIRTSYSRGRDRPVVGDWDGDGDDGIGVVRGDTWLLNYGFLGGTADATFTFGSPSYSELPVPGDWDGNGTETPGILRNVPPTDTEGGYERWLLRNDLSGGAAAAQFTYGSDALASFRWFTISDRLAFR